MTTIGVLGLGLIGGSVGLAAQRAGHEVLGWDADPATREEAAGAGLSLTYDFSAVDLVVLAVPVPSLTGGLTDTLAGVHLPPAATITDVGSLKVPVAAAITEAGLSSRYVGGHPMAGTERSGFTAATPDLFRRARWALCLDGDESDLARWLEVAAVITDLGAGAIAMTPTDHDAAMATVSGLPHLLALALSAAALDAGPLPAALTAGSFADLTRVAASDPALLRALIQDNGAALRMSLRRLLDQLDRPWPELITVGGAAKEEMNQSASAEASPERHQVVVSSARDLLELGRVGAVVESVAAASTGTVRYRLPHTASKD